MEKVVPYPGIDIDARWGYSHTKGRIFGYKLHLISATTGDLLAPLAADITTANLADNKMYVPLTSSSVFSLPFVLYTVADPGYDDKKLYEYDKKTLGIDLVCKVEGYKNTPKDRLEIMLLSIGIGTGIYDQRGISI